MVQWCSAVVVLFQCCSASVDLQVDEVIGIMHKNVENVLERDRKLGDLEERADALQDGCAQFEKQVTCPPPPHPFQPVVSTAGRGHEEQVLDGEPEGHHRWLSGGPRGAGPHLLEVLHAASSPGLRSSARWSWW